MRDWDGTAIASLAERVDAIEKQLGCSEYTANRDAPTKFRQKGSVVSAERFHADAPTRPAGIERGPDGWRMLLRSNEYQPVRDGDWIITQENGSRYPVRAEWFEKIYEPVKS